MISKEMMVKYALRGAQAELCDLQMKRSAVMALQPGMADVTPGEKERMVKALVQDIEAIRADIHELKNFSGI